jgi:hypothetical protein
MTPNRIVILLSPLFIALAGWLVQWVANNFPGAPQLDKTQLTAVFLAGATFAAAHVAQWLHGWQRHELRRAFTNPAGKALPEEPPLLNVKPVPPVGEPA